MPHSYFKKCVLGISHTFPVSGTITLTLKHFLPAANFEFSIRTTKKINVTCYYNRKPTQLRYSIIFKYQHMFHQLTYSQLLYFVFHFSGQSPDHILRTIPYERLSPASEPNEHFQKNSFLFQINAQNTKHLPYTILQFYLN